MPSYGGSRNSAVGLDGMMNWARRFGDCDTIGTKQELEYDGCRQSLSPRLSIHTIIQPDKGKSREGSWTWGP